MPQLATNRDLYHFIGELTKQQAASPLSLEAYLTNLRRLARARCQQPALSVAELAELLRQAFTPAELEADDSAASLTDAAPGFLDWERRLQEQLRDLRAMQEAGTFQDEQRYFGVSAPGGGYWYNFDPCTYLECGAAGSFGGWEDGDDTGREYVPGKVAVFDASGAMIAVDPRELEDPVTELPAIPWSELVAFLDAGQSYE